MSSSSPVSWASFKAALGELDHGPIEEEVLERPGSYRALDPRALYTSLEDFHRIMTSPWVQGAWVDLGAGVGESALYYGWLYPERKAFGVEWELPRVKAGEELRRKLGLNNVRLLHGDLYRDPIPEGETYFLYFPTGPVLDRVLVELRGSICLRRLIVIESHGDLLPRLRKESWLSEIGRVPVTSARHHPEALVFEPNGLSRADGGPHDLSFHRRLLLIRGAEGEWLGESEGLEWLGEERYQLLHPPRTIQWSEVLSVEELNVQTLEVRLLCWLRRQGEVWLKTRRGEIRGKLRKILVGPAFMVEISTSEWIKWEDIETIRQGSLLCYDKSSAYFFSPPAPSEW